VRQGKQDRSRTIQTPTHNRRRMLSSAQKHPLDSPPTALQNGQFPAFSLLNQFNKTRLYAGLTNDRDTLRLSCSLKNLFSLLLLSQYLKPYFRPTRVSNFQTSPYPAEPSILFRGYCEPLASSPQDSALYALFFVPFSAQKHDTGMTSGPSKPPEFRCAILKH
jgi:hypothetical protein